jgi:hypothetical protein
MPCRPGELTLQFGDEAIGSILLTFLMVAVDD